MVKNINAKNKGEMRVKILLKYTELHVALYRVCSFVLKKQCGRFISHIDM